MRKLTMGISLTAALVVTVQAETYVRANQLGYQPEREKAIVVMSDENLSGKNWSLKKGKKVVLSGTFKTSETGANKHTPKPFNYTLDFTSITKIGDYTIEVPGAAEATQFIVSADPYSKVTADVLRWLREARCGSSHVEDRGICHLADSAALRNWSLSDDFTSWGDKGDTTNRFDVSGGWHDAGDYLKFALTGSYATINLLRAYETNPALFAKIPSKENPKENALLNEARWGLNWLCKLMPNDSTFFIQVGDSKDHNAGNRLPEKDKLASKRPAITAMSKGQMGYVAAALAQGSRVFAATDKPFADKCAEMAKKVYHRAMKDDVADNISYNDKVNPFYEDQYPYENLQLASFQLWKLTGEESYLDASKKLADKNRHGTWRSYDAVYLTANLKLMGQDSIAKVSALTDLNVFQDSAKAEGNLWRLPLKYVWGSLYNQLAVGGDCFEYEKLTGDKTYRYTALGTLDYMLGRNNWGVSFVATTSATKPITQPYSQTYRIKSELYPTGAIAEGPCDTKTWDEVKKWMSYTPENEWTSKFNTSEAVFYDNRGDFATMETTICGVSEGLYVLAAAALLK